MVASDYDFQTQRDALIAAAYQKIGAIPQGATPSAAQITAAADTLNRIVKDLEMENVFLWALNSLEIQLVAAQANYAIGSEANAIALDLAFYRYEAIVGGSDTVDEPLSVITWREYKLIGHKETTGRPKNAAMDPVSKEIYLWPVPDTADKAYVRYVKKLKDYDTSTSVGDFPSEYERMLLYALCADLGDDWGLDISERERYQGIAIDELRKARKFGKENFDNHHVKGAFG